MLFTFLLLSELVHPQRGLKQGCPLSPILFAVYLADLGAILENSKLGVQVFGKTISGLLFADDLVLISRTREGIKHLWGVCQRYFEDHCLQINCSKSNIMDLKDEDYPPLHLWSTKGEDLGCFERATKYKYLGVPVQLSDFLNIFDAKRTEIVSRAKSYAAKIIGIARESFDPCVVAEALWTQVALEGILHGIQVVSVTEQQLDQLDSIQARIGAVILRVRHSCSHAAIRKELG